MTFRVLQKTRCVVGYFYILKFCPPGCNQQKTVLYLQPNRKNSATFVSVILFPGTNMCAVSLFRQLSLDSSDYHPVIITGAVTRMWEDRGEAPEFQKKNSNCWPDERQTWWKSSAHVLILTSITGGIQIIQIMNECQPAVHRCDTCCCSWPHLLLALRLQWEKKNVHFLMALKSIWLTHRHPNTITVTLIVPAGCSEITPSTSGRRDVWVKCQILIIAPPLCTLIQWVQKSFLLQRLMVQEVTFYFGKCESLNAKGVKDNNGVNKK